MTRFAFLKKFLLAAMRGSDEGEKPDAAQVGDCSGDPDERWCHLGLGWWQRRWAEWIGLRALFVVGMGVAMREEVLNNSWFSSICSGPGILLGSVAVSSWRNCQSYGRDSIYRTDPNTEQNLIPKGHMVQYEPT